MNDYNFFEIYEKKKGINIDPKSVYTIGSLILLIFVLISFGLVVRNMIIDKQIEQLNNQISSLEKSSEYMEGERLQASLTGMKEYDKNATEVLSSFNELNVLGTEYFSIITKSIPQNCTLESMEIDNAILTISINMPTKNTAAEAILYFKETKIFEEVHMLSLFTNEDKTGYVLTMECILKKEGEQL